MNARAVALGIRLFTSAAAVVSLDGCCGDPWHDSESIELGTDAELRAVIEVGDRLHDRTYTHVAVGSGGSVVAWGWAGASRFVEQSSVGEADRRAISAGGVDLRGIAAAESGWWVVGDGGMVAVSSDQGLTWTTVDLGTTANLHGITGVFVDELVDGSETEILPQSLVVVGDNVVFVRAPDGTWSEILAPGESWGQLRAVYYSHEAQVHAVGLGGVIWSTQDPSGPWIHDASGVAADLFDMGAFWDHERGEYLVAVVGAGGTLLIGRTGEWTRAHTGVSVDLIACDSGGVLAADGRVFEFGEKRLLVPIETFSGARALVFPRLWNVIVVGDDGMAREKLATCS